MNIAEDLRSAARWADDAAFVGLAPAHAQVVRALCSAAQGLKPAWSGSWLACYAPLYDKDLRPLPLHLRLPPGADTAPPPAALLARSRVWTRPEMEHRVRTRAGAPDMDMLAATARLASMRLDEALICCDALLQGLKAQSESDTELAVLSAAAERLKPEAPAAVIERWRPASVRGIEPGEPAAAPPHIAELAEMQALQAPFGALRKLAELMRYAAERLQTPARWRPALTPQFLARHLEAMT